MNKNLFLCGLCLSSIFAIYCYVNLQLLEYVDDKFYEMNDRVYDGNIKILEYIDENIYKIHHSTHDNNIPLENNENPI
jgi:hypothetical protein